MRRTNWPLNGVAAFISVTATLFACSSFGYPIVVGKDASGEDVYAIDGYPKMDDVSGPKAARYCQSRNLVTQIVETGYHGASFTFQCKKGAQ